MSSGSDSVGDLIPSDMLQVFSEERQGGRGKRGRRRIGSFSRAFRWLKSQRRKSRRRATEIRGDLLATGSPVELPPSTLKTGNTLPPCTPNNSVSFLLQNQMVYGFLFTVGLVSF